MYSFHIFSLILRWYNHQFKQITLWHPVRTQEKKAVLPSESGNWSKRTQNASFSILLLIFQQSDENRGAVDMREFRSKHPSPLSMDPLSSFPHFLYLVRARHGQKRQKWSWLTVSTLMVQEAPRQVSNYGPPLVCLTVMHTDKTALRPSLWHTRPLGSGPLQSLASFSLTFMATQNDKAVRMSIKKMGWLTCSKNNRTAVLPKASRTLILCHDITTIEGRGDTVVRLVAKLRSQEWLKRLPKENKPFVILLYTDFFFFTQDELMLSACWIGCQTFNKSASIFGICYLFQVKQMTWKKIVDAFNRLKWLLWEEFFCQTKMLTVFQPWPLLNFVH